MCTGNLCRSAMAEWGFEDYLRRLGRRNVIVGSAGVVAMTGSRASENAVKVLKEHGIDASGHRASELSRFLIQEADVVVGMTTMHVGAVTRLVPSATDKTFLLKGFARTPEKSGLEDPFGLDIGEYRACYEAIEECFEGLARYIPEETLSR